MKNILIVSPFFFPEPISTGKFNTDIAIALRDKGHKVTVLCSYKLYPKWVIEKSDEVIPGIDIIRGGGWIKYPKTAFLRRAILEIWFSYFMLKNIFSYRKNLDVIIPVFPPSLAFLLISLFLNKKIKRIGMVHDLQEVYSKEKKGFVSKFISAVINKIEGSSFRKCNRLIFLSEEMKETAEDFYNLKHIESVVQYPFSTLTEKTITNDLEELLPSNQLHVVYSGALGDKQNPIGLYDFFNFASGKIKNCHFHFFSQGYIFESLKQNNNNTAIKFHDLVPRENIQELYAKSTVQVVPQLPGTSKGSLPSKLPNLFASGCKVLAVTDPFSEIDILFKKYNLEKVVTTWDQELLFNALIDILHKEVSINQNQMINDLFSLDSMIQKIV